MPIYEKVIQFSGSSHPRTGFLSNDSMHRFRLGDKVWPSVTHFLEAAKFKGTQREEDIRNASTVHQAKRLGKGRGVGVSHTVRDDWDAIKASLMADAVQAKFIQNKRIQDKLLRTRNAHLIDITEPLSGPALERVRDILRGVDHPQDCEAVPVEKTDVDDEQLPKEYRRLANCTVKLSLRIADMEGWDVVHEGMVEDAIYNLCKKKKLGKKGIRFVSRVTKELSWSTIYYEMPNFESWMDTIQQILGKKGCDSDKIAAMISVFVLWVYREISPEKKRKIMERSQPGVCKKIELCFLKKERWYRASPPRLPGAVARQMKSRKMKRKAKRKKRKRSGKKSEKRSGKKLSSPKASPERKRSSLDDEEEIEISPPKESPSKDFVPLERRVAPITVVEERKPKNPPRHLKIVDTVSTCGGSFYVWGQSLHRYAAQLLSLGGIYPSHYRAPQYIERKDVIQFKGAALEKYRQRLLEIGGKYPYRYREEKINDRILEISISEVDKHQDLISELESKRSEDVIIYQVENLTEEDIDLLKKIGARHPVLPDPDRKKNLKVIQFRGDHLETNRQELEKMGGQYPKQQTHGGGMITDKSRIIFNNNHHRSEAEQIVLDSLEGMEKYVAAYQMWIKEKLSEYIDTSIQLLVLIQRCTIHDSDIRLVVNDLYGCYIPDNVSHQPLEYSYRDIILNLISNQNRFISVTITDKAVTLLSKYIEYQGRSLTRSLQCNPKKAFANFQKRLSTEKDFLNQRGLARCRAQEGFNSDQVCIIRALNHIYKCFIGTALNEEAGKIAAAAFLTVIPIVEWREQAKSYINEMVDNLDGDTSYIWIEDRLKSKGIRYHLDKIVSVLGEDPDQTKGRYLGILAAAVYYISPKLRGSQYPIIMDRVKLLADLSLCGIASSPPSSSEVSHHPPDTILFASPLDDWGFLSNLYISPFTIEKVSYPSVEHYYQSQKFTDIDDDAYRNYAQLIQEQPTPTKASFLGDMKREVDGSGVVWPWQQELARKIQEAKSQGVRLRDDWPVVNQEAMMTGLQAKFDQNLDLAEKLVETEGAQLVKRTPSGEDRYWGDAGDKGSGREGQNKLGKLLMRIRDELE